MKVRIELIVFIFINISIVCASSCSRYTTCESCADVDGCSYCPSLSACIENSAVCVPNEKRGRRITSSNYCAAANPFEKYTNCQTCANVDAGSGAYIGWCPSEAKCYFGSSSKPLNHTCIQSETNGRFTVEPNYCAATNPTQTYKTCETCANVDGGSGAYIGWCPSEAKCYFGSSSKPLNHTCLANEKTGIFTVEPNNCAATNVSRYDNCSSCTAVAHLLPGRYYSGWCPMDNACYVGTDHNPLNHTCIASDKAGIWSYNSDMCNAIEPVNRLKNCTACTAVAHNLPGEYYTGFCPTDNVCYVGTSDGPLNRSCTTSDSLGIWTYSENACNAVFPTKNLRSCSTCTQYSNTLPGSFRLGWSGSEQACYVGINNSVPLNHSIVVDPNLGGYITDCSCVPILSNNEHTCHSCDNTFCYYGQYCVATNSETKSNPCFDNDDCGTMCLCTNTSSSNCTLCKAGHTNPIIGCAEECSPNCFDCYPNNRTSCLSMCSAGFTNFPECNELCPPKCLACGDSFNSNHQNHSSHLNKTQCLACSDPGAKPPNCDTCVPYVCKGVNGACNQPCNDKHGNLTISSNMVIKDDAKYPNCDACKDAINHIIDYAQILQKVMNSEEEAELVGLAMELDCAVLPPPLDVACGFIVTAVDAGTGITWLVTWIGEQILERLASMDFCMVSRQCQYPCSPSRQSTLKSLLYKHQYRMYGKK